MLNCCHKTKSERGKKTMDKQIDEIWQQAIANMRRNILQSDLTLQQLATKAGISVNTLRNFVSGKTNIMQTTTIIKICDALNMKVDEFIGRIKLYKIIEY